MFRPGIYCKCNYRDCHITCKPFCSLTKLQLLLLFTDFGKVFCFINLMLIPFMPSWHFPTIFGLDHDMKKTCPYEGNFCSHKLSWRSLAHSDTSLLSLHWPWERNVLGVYEEEQQIQMGTTRAACVTGECRKKL